MRKIVSLFLIAAFGMSLALPSMAATKVPPGNRSATQPKIPSGSISRTSQTNSSFQAKYEKIRDLIKTNKQLQGKIKKAASEYGIDPIHIVGALVGEHTYNVDATDTLQTYVIKAISYFKEDIAFEHNRESVMTFVKRPEFEKCNSLKNSYDLWACRETVWKSEFQGKSVDGVTWPNDRFGRVFFQPFYAGQTFGLGQINPLTALQVTDMVAQKSGKRKLSANKANEVYKTIIDPDTTLIYMAAIIRTSIDAYKTLADLDISGNPGITATLYNLGDVKSRAQRSKGKIPRENYYGWLVNDKLEELKTILK